MMDIDKVAFELAEKLEAKKHRYQRSRTDRRDAIERVIRDYLREELAAPAYAVFAVDEFGIHQASDGLALARPATEAERAQFAPLHAALERQREMCKQAHWEHKLAQRKAVGQ